MAEINYINTIAQLEVRIAELGDAASAEAYALYAEIILLCCYCVGDFQRKTLATSLVGVLSKYRSAQLLFQYLQTKGLVAYPL